MRARLDARSWLLVAFAAWALCCAIAAVRFGGRYTLFPDARPAPATTAKARPTTAAGRTPSSNALGPLADYAAASDRPLFYPDRKPAAVHVAGKPSAAQALNVVLTSVILTPTLQMAIVQDNTTRESLRVKQGEPLGSPYEGWKLVGMTPRSVVFDGGSQGQTTLELRVFDGHGGEEPTRMGLTPQAIAAGVLGAAPPPPPPNANGIPISQSVVEPDSPLPTDTSAAPDDASNAAANAAAADAALQAEQIRQRIEQRRQQMQAEGADATPPNDKVK